MPAERWLAALERAADRVVEHCVDLDPPGTASRRSSDGRSVWIEPTAPGLTSEAVLVEEEAIVAWAIEAQLAEPNPSTTVDTEGLDVLQADAAAAVAGWDDLVLVVGPAGTGKTTMLARAREDLHRHTAPAFGLAPTAKAARVLERDTGMLVDTVAKLLYEWSRPDLEPGSPYRLPKSTTVMVDEAGMIGSHDLARLVSWPSGTSGGWWIEPEDATAQGGRRRVVPVEGPVRPSSPLELVRGQRIEQLVVVRGEVREPDDRLDGGRVDGLELGQDRSADPCPRLGRIGVGGVEPVVDPRLVERRAQGGSPGVEQRTHDPAAPRRHAPQPVKAGAACQVEENRLGPVIGRMGGGDQRLGAQLIGDLLQECVARGAAGLLDPAAIGRRQRGDIGPAQPPGQREGIGRSRSRTPRHRPSRLGGHGPGGRRPAATGARASGARRVEQRHGVGSTRHRENERDPVGDANQPSAFGQDPDEEGVGSGGRIRTTGQGLMSPLLYH